MEAELTGQGISSGNSNGAVVLNGTVFNLSSFGTPSDYTADKFDANSTSGFLSDGVTVVDTSRGLAVLTVGGEIDLNSITLNSAADLGQLNSQTGSHLYSISDPGVHDEETSSDQLFVIKGEDGIEASQLYSVTDPVTDDDATTSHLYVVKEEDSHILDATSVANPNELQYIGGADGVIEPIVPTVIATQPCQQSTVPKRRGGWPKGKRRKPEKESHAPKAPASAYVIYATERRKAIKEQNSHIPFIQVTKLLGSEWTRMPMHLKQKYLDLAEADKKRYVDELTKYRESDAYQRFLERKKANGHSQGGDAALDSSPNLLDNMDTEELYCQVCDIYFTSHHNRKEHMFGKVHLQNVTSEFEKELRKEQEAENEAVNSDTSQESSRTINPATDPDDMESFITKFMQKNHDRDCEIHELRRSLDIARQRNEQLVNKIHQLKDVECTVQQELAVQKTFGASLNAQIDGLKMVPTLFGVINL